ncbi:similar to CW7 [Actinidia rufa]|uniref:Similar to CW7 n=1 Tax=Actinidia rufa TaxID=165716 RepID=A0A7J0DWG6_9ERIC|nr:similar to CW7 [Actinidia rufa]
MLSDREETPTRLELLSMVKKHSKLLGKTIVDKEDASDVEMDSRFWHDVMDLYFVRGRESRGRQDDDLVFFVRKLILQGYGSSDDMEGNSPYFVRRWAPKSSPSWEESPDKAEEYLAAVDKLLKLTEDKDEDWDRAEAKIGIQPVKSRDESPRTLGKGLQSFGLRRGKREEISVKWWKRRRAWQLPGSSLKEVF